MSAILIADVTINDPDAYKTYRDQVMATLQPYGGEFIARGGAVTPLEGGWDPQRIVVIRFADPETAKAWYDGPEYQAIIDIRKSACASRLILVEGV